MEFSEIMVKLSDNYKVGIGIGTGIVVVLYISVSVFSIRRVYKYKGYVSLKGMIPIVHLFLFLVGRGKPKKKNQTGESNVTESKVEDQGDSNKGTDESDTDDLDLEDLDIF